MLAWIKSFLRLFAPGPRSKLVEAKPDPKGRHDENLLITLRFEPHWFAAKLGEEAYDVTYSGSVTVWHNIKTGRRANTWMEGKLSNIAWKYNRDRRDREQA
jgi:hypothetical protein